MRQLTADTPKHDEGREALVAALASIWRYGADTLSGRADGPDDRDWQRAAVQEMTKRAREALPFDPRSEDSRDAMHAALAIQPAARRVTDGDAWRWVSERAWFVDAAAHAFDLRFGPGDFSTEPRNADADDVREAIFAAMREEAGPEAEDSRESFAQPAEGVSGGNG